MGNDCGRGCWAFVSGTQAARTYASQDRLTADSQQGAASSSSQVQTPLTGKRKSLFIGINYTGQASELSGCQADVHRLRPVLERMGFASGEDQMLLIDDGYHTTPTRENMIRAFQWLLSEAQMGDSLFLHYSGHGGREESQYGDTSSSDGFHETLVPVDYQEAGQLLDTELFELLVRPLPTGVKLTCLIDACHSAGALNLPYLFTGTAENLNRALAGEAMQMVASKNWLHDVQSWQDDGNPVDLITDVASMGLGLWQLYEQKQAAAGANEAGYSTGEGLNIGISVGEVVAFTGCRSDQTSADVGDVSSAFQIHEIDSAGRGSLLVDPQKVKAGGALTSVFLESMGSGESLSYLSLLETMRQRLQEEGFSQVPQLASSLLLDLNCPFMLDRLTLPSPQTAHGAKGQAGPHRSGVSDFLSAFAGTPHGNGMIQNARGIGTSSSPYAPIMSDSGGIGLLGLLEGVLLQSSSNDSNSYEEGSFNDNQRSLPQAQDMDRDYWQQDDAGTGAGDSGAAGFGLFGELLSSLVDGGEDMDNDDDLDDF